MAEPQKLWDLFDQEPDLPVLPYAGTSGHGGNGASKARALSEDSFGITTRRQKEAYLAVADAGFDGLTGNELCRIMDWNTGQSSGALSNLHGGGFLSRLKERRNKSGVYVLPSLVMGRETERKGSHGHKFCPNCGHDLRSDDE